MRVTEALGLRVFTKEALEAGNIGNIEAFFTDLLGIMQNIVKGPLPTEEEASYIAKGVVSDFCQQVGRTRAQIRGVLQQWLPKIFELTAQIWLSEAFFTESRLPTRNMWAYKSRDSPG